MIYEWWKYLMMVRCTLNFWSHPSNGIVFTISSTLTFVMFTSVHLYIHLYFITWYTDIIYLQLSWFLSVPIMILRGHNFRHRMYMLFIFYYNMVHIYIRSVSGKVVSRTLNHYSFFVDIYILNDGLSFSELCPVYLMSPPLSCR